MIPRSSAGAEEAPRPIALILVYTWDVVRGVAALLGAIVAFGAGVSVHGHVVQISTGAQILAALAAASLAGALFVVGTLLTRRRAWVRRAQIVVLLMDAALATGSVALDQLTAHAGVDLSPLLGVALFALIDLCAVTAMTAPRMTAWFHEPGPVPLYVGGLIAFWAATSVAFVLLRTLNRGDAPPVLTRGDAPPVQFRTFASRSPKLPPSPALAGELALLA